MSKQLDPLSSHPWNAMDSSVNKTTIFIHVHWYLQWIPSHELCQEQLKTLECQLLDSTAEKARACWQGSWVNLHWNFDIDMCPIHVSEDHLMFEGVMALHQLSTASPRFPTLQEEIRSLLKDLAAQTSACAKAQVQSIEWFGKLAAEMLFGFIYFNETHLNWTRTASNQCCVD